MQIGSSPAPSAPSAPSAPAAPASKPETPSISSSPSTTDRTSISSDARGGSSTSPGVGSLTSGLSDNYSDHRREFMSDLSNDYAKTGKATKKAALAADTVEGAAHAAHHVKDATGGLAKTTDLLGKALPAAKVASGGLTALTGTMEAAGHLSNPNLSGAEKALKVTEAATCSAAAWAGGTQGAAYGAGLGATGGPLGALAGGAVGGGFGAYAANTACKAAFAGLHGASADQSHPALQTTMHGAP